MNNQRNGEKLKPILENEGFKHIANAIRQSTITAQHQKQLNDRNALTYDIRYGLGRDLKRKSHRSKEFMEALSLFLQQYSEETARQEEKLELRLNRSLTLEDRRTYKARMNISDRDIADITQLIDDYGSGLMCSKANIYSAERVTNGKERYHHIILPYHQFRSSRSYSWYQRIV